MRSRGNKRVFTSFWVVILGCICSLRFQPVHAFIDEQEIAECAEDLGEADVNVNGRLDSDEFLSAIALRSGTALLFDTFDELPVSFISTFYFSSCTGKKCQGVDPFIDLSDPSVIPSFCFNLANAIAAELNPTVVPGTPTVPPTDFPTKSPTMSPTPAPTIKATPLPTIKITSPPTPAPTPSPSSLPTMETPMPTPEALICVTFQYGVSNNNGFSADDLFNENGNTFKTGLLIATETVLIEVLNSTLFTDDETRLLRGSVGDHRERHIHLVSSDPSPQRRRTAYLDQSSNLPMEFGRRRKLVFYTQDWPVTIDAIIPNPFSCPEDSDCAVVSSTVCVLLEEGDEEVSVRATVLGGMETAIESGAFEAAVPPENQFS